VRKVIPLGLRRLKKQGLFSLRSLKEFFAMLKKLRFERYDLIIDAQGLYKSAVLALLARGKRVGLAKGSSRENVAWLYQQSFPISFDQHASARVRTLFAEALAYQYDPAVLDFKLGTWSGQDSKNLVFIHATTWATKHYPEEYWRDLAVMATGRNWSVALPQVTTVDEARALMITKDLDAEVLPKMSLTALRDYLSGVRGFISVDTGLAHIAAAMGVPGLVFYGPTNPKHIGTVGQNQEHLAVQFECAPCLLRQCNHPDRVHKPTPPCYRMLAPKIVWEKFNTLLSKTMS
jgi:heptosyltransferase-1